METNLGSVHNEFDISAYTEEVAKRKAGWPDGPWKTEPDRVEWRCEGFPCLMTRNSMGAWCGYVGVPEGHPWYGLDTSSLEDLIGNYPHRGITYGNTCVGHICHVAAEGEPDNVFWVGFDCAHAGDITPAYADHEAFAVGPRGPRTGNAYRDLAYVQKEVNELAGEATNAKKATNPVG